MGEHTAPVAAYDDDRYGMMRVHIAQRRGDLACDRYTRNNLRAFATGHKVTPSSLRKRDLATRMAYEGFIDAEGYLRDGFPSRAIPPGSTDARPTREDGSARTGLLICAATALGSILAAPHVVGYLARTPEALAAVAVAVAWWVGVALERRYDKRWPMTVGRWWV